jgi:uncharacterized membrane-anchored protein YhcB (DUF1043 family)
MDPVNYYITTLTNAFKNIAPILGFIVVGYFIFVKGPFLFLKKSLSDQKKKFEEENKDIAKVEKYTVDDYKEFQRKLKLMNNEEVSTQKVLPDSRIKKETSEQKKAEHKKTEQKKTGQQRKEEPKKDRSTKSPEPHTHSPEEVFNFRPGESFSQSELKKRYFELLKQNHPDRVASMGSDFKKLAEKNTKDINKAFEALKKRAS